MPRPVGELGGSQDRAVAADHQHQLAVSRSGRPRARARRRSPPGSSPSRAASAGSRRTTMPCARQRLGEGAATSRASSRPVWATSSTRRLVARLGSRGGHGSTFSPGTPNGSARHHGAVDLLVGELRGAAPQPQEELDVARRARQRTASPPAGRPSPVAAAAAATRRPPRPAAPGRGRRRPCRAGPCRPRTAASPSAPGRPSGTTTPSSASSTSAREMNDRSPTTTSTGPPISSGVRSRMLVRSCTTTRSSCCSGQASWP